MLIEGGLDPIGHVAERKGLSFAVAIEAGSIFAISVDFVAEKRIADTVRANLALG
jgi:hypothetical protein